MLNTAFQFTPVSSSNRGTSPATVPHYSWFAVQVKRHLEVSVATHLQNQGFETVLPLCRTRREWSDRIKTVDVPLFPGYLFCEFDPSNRMPIDLIPGVNGIVGFGNKLAEVDRAEISAIRSVLAAGLEVAPWPRLEVGRKVEIYQGPLRGLVGVVVGDKNNHRLILSVTLLNRSVSVEMDRRWFRIFD
jgi:transcription antitermination factor NusG